MNKLNTKSLYSSKLNEIIPGGAHTYSRGDDQFPSNAPSILERGKGAYVYDPEGNEYLDYGMGLRSVNIGYGNEEIVNACYDENLKGNNLTRASTTELKAAELLRDLIPSVDMVKFAKHGSVVTTAAIKLARAYTGRKYIAVPEEQPFFSFDDWFIGSTDIKKGTLEESNLFTLKFNYNNINSLERLFDLYPEQIAGVILEPATSLSPCDKLCNFKNKCIECPNNSNNFLQKVQKICTKHNSVFILDEMITGFRWHIQGAQTFFNVEPDLCTFGKAMGNGFAVSALAGKKEIMQIAGIKKLGLERVFLTSTTHGAEMGALGAFIKTIEILKRDNVIDNIWKNGKKLIKGINLISEELGILDKFYLEGYPCLRNFISKDNDGIASLPMRTLFLQEMMEKKVMIPYIAVSFSHKQPELEKTFTAARHALHIYKKALESGLDNYLKSPVVKPVFRKYN